MCLRERNGKPDKIDEMLLLLSDGEERGLEDVAERLQLTMDKTLLAVLFLAKFNFVEFNENKDRVRIDSEVRKLYVEG